MVLPLPQSQRAPTVHGQARSSAHGDERGGWPNSRTGSAAQLVKGPRQRGPEGRASTSQPTGGSQHRCATRSGGRRARALLPQLPRTPRSLSLVIARPARPLQSGGAAQRQGGSLWFRGPRTRKWITFDLSAISKHCTGFRRIANCLRSPSGRQQRGRWVALGAAGERQGFRPERICAVCVAMSVAVLLGRVQRSGVL
jgi:hypothetical protein